jgi:hypothetical protein
MREDSRLSVTMLLLAGTFTAIDLTSFVWQTFIVPTFVLALACYGLTLLVLESGRAAARFLRGKWPLVIEAMCDIMYSQPGRQHDKSHYHRRIP